MNAAQILGICRFKVPLFEIKAHLKLHTDHFFEARQHQARVNFACRQDLLVMRPLIAPEHVPRCYSIPKLLLAERLEPLLDILNVFKNNHEDSVPNQTPSQQIW